jgi:hypothetical protein
MGFAGYVAVFVQLYCRRFTVLHLVVAVLHYMFRPTWPFSSVYDVFTFIFLNESASLVLLARGFTLCTFPFVLFCCSVFLVNFAVSFACA